MASVKIFYKQPSERLDFDVDYSDFFEESDLDEIAQVESADVTIVDMAGDTPTLELDAAPIIFGDEPQRRVKLWLTAGADGHSYKVSVHATTDNGREIETDFILKIKDR